MSSESLKKNDKVKDYIIEKKIGEGAFGKTYLAKKGEKKYVLKITGINSRGNGKEKEISDYIKNNMSDNKNLFYYDEYFNEDNKDIFVSEYIGDTLRNYLKHGESWEIKEIQNFAKQILVILYSLHSNCIYHRDIKPENICVKLENEKESGKIYKIIDYGSGIIQAKEEKKEIIYLTKKEYFKRQFGTSNYLHPKINEMIYCGKEKAELYYENIDIWSLGLICLEMFSGETLYKYDQNTNAIEEEEYRIPFYQDKTYIEYVEFIDCMLQYEYNKQSSICELLKLDFIKKEDPKDFKTFPIEVKKDNTKYEIKDNKEYLKLNLRKGELNFNYDALLNKNKETLKKDLIKQIFIKLYEEELFTEPVLIPLIKTENRLNNENNEIKNNESISEK